ncbi:MAG TPA: 3-hydroxylacyl-ACP dehydratase [Candidatus Binatia bacterium]|nr:3-hydroxylacyl-ACP dehydratase [Candidatus Binatia bacterium]
MSRPYTPHQALPHGPDMVLLDRVLDWDAEHARCSVAIRRTSRFFEPGRGVPGWVGIEYMAQCIGVWAGIQRLEAGQPVIIGLLLGTRAYEFSCEYFTEGQQLAVEVEMLVRDSTGVGAFACVLRDDTGVLARGDVKAYQPDDITGYLKSLAGENA